LINNNTICNNYTDQLGGGIHVLQSNPRIVNNIFYGNIAQFYGGGIYLSNCAPVITNNIFWQDSANGGFNELCFSDSDPILSFCNIQGGWPGQGNIDLDPLFRDPDNGDFHLMAIGCGDPYNSPCIDMGHPDIIDSLLDCDWGLGMQRSDMGAYGGGESAVGIDEPVTSMPDRTSLSQNYPNPFNASTVIKYELPQQSQVTIDIYDILGRKVTTLVDKQQPAGYYQTIWRADDFSSGIYFYKLQAGDYNETKKMSLLK